MSEIYNSYPKTFTIPEGAVKFKVVVHGKTLADLPNIDINAFQTTLIAEEVTLDDMPFSVEMPALDHKFQAVRGTGCELNLISDTDMRFFNGLQHNDKKEFIVKHYVDGLINWVGYLNSEMNRESYSESLNYPVQVTGNDGFALMDRIQFLDDNDAIFTGIKSQFEIIKIIFNKIGLPFGELRVSLSTTSPSFAITGTSTILHQSFIDCANFYNEDGEAMTLREVLEAVLKPYGAFATQTAGNITITDVHTAATGGPVTFKRYSMTDWLFYGNITVNPVKSIEGVGYMGTGAEIEISGGKNKQVVTYSPYPLKEILKGSVSDLNEFGTVDFAWTNKGLGCFKTLTQNKYWSGLCEVSKSWISPVSTYANSTLFPATGVAENTYIATSPSGYHYRWNGWKYVIVDPTVLFGAEEYIQMKNPYSATNVLGIKLKQNSVLVLPKSEYDTGLSYVQLVKGSSLLFKGKLSVILNSTYYQNMYTAVYITLKISIGNNYYNGVNWLSTDPNTFYRALVSMKDNEAFIAAFDTPKVKEWALNIGANGEDGILIPVTEDLSGVLSFEIWSDTYRNTPTTPADPAIYVETWYSQLAIELVQPDNAVIPDKDIEYIGYLNQNFKDEAEKVELICGTESVIADRGKIMYLTGGVYKPIRTWTRNGQTYKIEELLLRSLSSNYRTGYRTLNNMKLKNGFDQLSVITDEPFLPGKKFMVKSSTVNYRDNLIEASLVEVSPDELTLDTDVTIKTIAVPRIARNKRIYPA